MHKSQAERPARDGLSNSKLEQRILGGLELVKAAGCQPLVVVPRFLRDIDAPTVIVADDLFDVDEGSDVPCKQKNGAAAPQPVLDGITGNILVFCGPMSSARAHIVTGRLPDCPSLIVFENGQWRLSRRNEVRRLKLSPASKSAVWSSNYFHPDNYERLEKWKTNLYARRLQPWGDTRETDVLETIASGSDFPYKLSNVVSGRVLLGIGTLGSGGAERQILNTAEGLRQRGISDVHLLVEHLDGAGRFYLDKAVEVTAGVHTVSNDLSPRLDWVLNHREFRQILTDSQVSRVLNVAQLLQQLAPEIVQTSLDWTNITVGLAAALAGVPHILVSGRNLAPLHFEFFQWFMYPCYRALASHPHVTLLNNSEAGSLDYAKWLKLPAKQIKVLRNGLNTEEFKVVDDAAQAAARHELGLDKSAKVVAGAFRLSDEKRPILWVETAAEIADRYPGISFLLCGIGPAEQAVRERANTLGLSDRLQFLGARSDIQLIFAASDVVLQTSLQEGTPNTLIEAQAMGIPVVSTPAYGAAEAIEHGVTGIVVRDETATGLAQAVHKILSDKSFSENARVAGPKFINKLFGFQRMIDDTLIAYADSGVSWACGELPEHLKYKASYVLTNASRVKGHSYQVTLPELTSYADTAANAFASPIVILEDGKSLGPPHTVHVDIAKNGNGAFSHWGNSIYFSSSDGTDPTTNGRHYQAVLLRGR